MPKPKKTRQSPQPEPTPEEWAEGLGIVFRIANPRHRRVGRMTVFQDDLGAMKTHSKEAARTIARAVNGRVVPHVVAERMVRKHDRRMQGWELPWILYDLPQRQRE